MSAPSAGLINRRGTVFVQISNICSRPANVCSARFAFRRSSVQTVLYPFGTDTLPLLCTFACATCLGKIRVCGPTPEAAWPAVLARTPVPRTADTPDGKIFAACGPQRTASLALGDPE
jgi:hypothetical protein